MQKTPYKNPKKILAQIWRTLKRKISATCCFTTRYADFCGERGTPTFSANILIFNCLEFKEIVLYRICTAFQTIYRPYRNHFLTLQDLTEPPESSISSRI